MSTWWLSCSKFTICVTVDDDHIITEAAPIARKFVGQPAANLKRWMQKLGSYRACRIG